MKPFLKLLSLFLIILTLAGCGLKGPLYYPAEKADISNQFSIFN